MRNIKEEINAYFKQYLMHHSIESLKITDLCKDLSISRKTFYMYYHDKYDILEDIFVVTIIDPLRKLLDYNISVYEVEKVLYQNFLNNKDFYSKALKYNGQNSLLSILVKHIKLINDEIVKSFPCSDIDKEYIAYFYASAQAMLLLKWIDEGMIVSPERVAEYCDEMISKPFDSLRYHVFNK